MSSQATNGTTPSPAHVTPELIAAAIKLATAVVPAASDGGAYRRISSLLADARLFDCVFEAPARDGEGAAGDVLLGGGRDLDRLPLQGVEDLPQVVGDGGFLRVVRQDDRHGDLQGEEASGDLDDRVVDVGIVHAASPSGEGQDEADAPLAGANPTGDAESQEDEDRLPSHLRIALQRIASYSYTRGRRGFWLSAGRLAIPSDHVSQLTLRNMAKVFPGNRSPDRVEVTDLGRSVLDGLRAKHAAAEAD